MPRYGYFKDLCRLWQEAKNLKREDFCSHVCQFYAQQILKEASGENVTSAAKFAPREGKKYKMMIQEIAVHMFGQGSKTLLRDYRKKLGEATAHYKQITEQLMSQRRWADIDPKYVPSLCFHHNKKNFLNLANKEGEDRKACKDKFEEHIKKAARGEAKVNAKALFVHQVVEQMLQYHPVAMQAEDEENANS